MIYMDNIYTVYIYTYFIIFLCHLYPILWLLLCHDYPIPLLLEGTVHRHRGLWRQAKGP